MKIASILAGVAIAALTASTASADVINKGQYTNHSNVGGVITPGTTVNVPADDANLVANQDRALNGSATRSTWHAVGASAGNQGDVGADKTTFTLKGKVSSDCVYYSGDNSSETFDFGTLGIYAGDNTGPTAAFTMVAPATLTIQTNLAGCNTNNTVTLSRTNADMTNNSGAGFNNAVFTKNLPYKVTAGYQGATQAGGGAAVTRAQLLDFGQTNKVESNGAWKSPMSLNVVVDSGAKALLAGNYEGTFELTLTPTL